ncbi:hypothetical protein SAMN04489806_2129 [Paramicrobacterium humi]|uniref:HPt domain-containing protein n=1 Tax=Paramicrobacterium humi TaxID=640635 RepID=A0A1H4N9V6_9MICO|nr:hypothetical protein [Microbacterium humi]SEB92096.1 hypothetical protein SAMN04489806_2129 [Microbacterium humi]
MTTVCASSELNARVAVDARCLERLCADLGGDMAAIRGFVSTFMKLWPGRLARVTSAAERADFDDLLDSTLSIRSASRMLGAMRLDYVAEDVERSGRAGDISHVRCLIPSLATTGEQTLDALTGVLDARG